MKKFLSLIVILSFCLSGCGNNDNKNSLDNNESSNNYTTSRTSISDNTNDDNNINDSNDDINNNINNDNDINTETELSSFSTKIYTPNDKARQNNIQITCSKLNGTLVKPRRNIFFL